MSAAAVEPKTMPKGKFRHFIVTKNLGDMDIRALEKMGVDDMEAEMAVRWTTMEGILAEAKSVVMVIGQLEEGAEGRPPTPHALCCAS